MWSSMNHNERGFLQGTIEGRRSSTSPLRIPVRQKGKHSFPSASSDAYAEKELRVRSHCPATFQVRTFKFNCGPTRTLGRDVSFTGLRSIQPWRIAD